MVSVNNLVNNIFKNQPITSTAVSYTALPTDVIIDVTNTAAVRTITIPTASSVNLGKSYLIKDTSGGASTNNILITPVSGTIDGSSSLVIVTNYGFLQVYSNGTNWLLNLHPHYRQQNPQLMVSGGKPIVIVQSPIQRQIRVVFLAPLLLFPHPGLISRNQFFNQCLLWNHCGNKFSNDSDLWKSIPDVLHHV